LLRFSAPDTLGLATTQDGGTDRLSLVSTRLEVSFTSVVSTGWQRSAAFALERLSHGFDSCVFPR
jgi:hypothetical protein